jgi:hypothetical protein
MKKERLRKQTVERRKDKRDKEVKKKGKTK